MLEETDHKKSSMVVSPKTVQSICCLWFPAYCDLYAWSGIITVKKVSMYVGEQGHNSVDIVQINSWECERSGLPFEYAHISQITEVMKSRGSVTYRSKVFASNANLYGLEPRWMPWILGSLRSTAVRCSLVSTRQRVSCQVPCVIHNGPDNQSLVLTLVVGPP